MTTDYRALIERLAYDLELLADAEGYVWPLSLVNEAREALAQPEPVGVTDEEIEREALENADSDDEYRAFKSGAFFVQERISRPAIEPVPVSERLPGVEDCDAEGRCWFFHTSTIGGNEWFLSQLPKVSEWYRWQSITHWLPAHALPLPLSEGGAA